MNSTTEIRSERADHPQVVALLDTGSDRHDALRLYERCGDRRRGAFGGHHDKGMSVFRSKVLS